MNRNKSEKWFKTVCQSVVALWVAALVCVWNPSVGYAQEHPAEHPTTTPPKAESKSKVTLEEVATYIESYVKDHSKDGIFSVIDKSANKDLSLKLDKIYRKRLSKIGPDMFFVCADFNSVDGKLYDLDFFVQGTSKKTLRVLEDKTSVHKENGKERYTWTFNVKKGIWEQKPIETTDKKSPEHPAKENP